MVLEKNLDQGNANALRKKCPYWELFWSSFFPHFPTLGLNTERYGVSLHIQSECWEMREKCGPG